MFPKNQGSLLQGLSLVGKRILKQTQKETQEPFYENSQDQQEGRQAINLVSSRGEGAQKWARDGLSGGGLQAAVPGGRFYGGTLMRRAGQNEHASQRRDRARRKEQLDVLY